VSREKNMPQPCTVLGAAFTTLKIPKKAYLVLIEPNPRGLHRFTPGERIDWIERHRPRRGWWGRGSAPEQGDEVRKLGNTLTGCARKDEKRGGVDGRREVKTKEDLVQRATIKKKSTTCGAQLLKKRSIKGKGKQ